MQISQTSIKKQATEKKVRLATESEIVPKN